MEHISYFFRFLWKIKWWLILGPLFVALIVIYGTRNLPHYFEAETTIYVGNMSNYSEEGTSPTEKNNIIENLVHIISAKSTLQRVSLQLYAEDMIYGNPDKDNNYIQAKNFNYIQSITPEKVKKLIDKNSVEETVKRLSAFAQSDTENFLYGLFNWSPPYYSYQDLSKISVIHMKGTDMIQIKYSTDDPGIAYHTLVLLNKEFMKQYEQLKYGETNDVIHFFEMELAKVKTELKNAEDSLTNYSVKNKIINYNKQTEQLTFLNSEYELQYEYIEQDYEGASSRIQNLEQRLTENAKALRNNSLFIQKLNQISDLSAKIARIEILKSDSSLIRKDSPQLNFYKEQLKQQEKEFKTFSDSLNLNKYTKEGYINIDLLDQWLTELLNKNEAEAKLDAIQMWKKEIDSRYAFYSPIGSTLKRKERNINFTESSYLELLRSLNTARLRQKSLQMNAANIQVLTAPSFPLESVSAKRKMKVLASFFCSFFFLLVYFLIVEIFDHTLRDKIRTERITSGNVLYSWPDSKKLHHRGYSKIINHISSKYLGKALLQFLEPGKPFILNIFSMEEQEGKTYIAQQLTEYYQSLGLKVKFLSWHNDFSIDSEKFVRAKNLQDLYQPEGEYIYIIEYPAIQKTVIPQNLLQQATFNILVARATRVWKSPDRIELNNLVRRSASVPVQIVLNQTRQGETEYFTGLLPPYTTFRKLLYRILQLGLTSREQQISENDQKNIDSKG